MAGPGFLVKAIDIPTSIASGVSLTDTIRSFFRLGNPPTETQVIQLFVAIAQGYESMQAGGNFASWVGYSAALGRQASLAPGPFWPANLLGQWVVSGKYLTAASTAGRWRQILVSPSSNHWVPEGSANVANGRVVYPLPRTG